MRLFLLRHGKPDYFYVYNKDIQRELSEEGKAELESFKNVLEIQYKSLEFSVYCSSAVRTRETFEIIKKGISVKEVSFHEELYLASREELVHFFQHIQPLTENVMLVGHNNGISNFASFLTDQNLLFPPGGCVELDFPLIDKWTYLGAGTGSIKYKNF